MAGSVLIDIPGVGTVEAKNAASEATLAEILKILKKADKETGSFKKAMGGGTGGGGTGSSSDAGNDAGESKAAKGPNALGKAAMAVGLTFGIMHKAVSTTTGAIVGLGESATATLSKFANVGDSLENAASIFSGIPLIGPMFSAVAGAATKVTDAYQKAAASGATFGGSINQFAAAASSAGMTMAEFSGIIAKNGYGMTAFGQTTEDGAKRFAQISKAVRTSAGDLYALGYSTADINQGLANYGALLKAQGLQGKQSNAELAAGAKRYLKEIDGLAKITGEERSVKEAEMKKLASDAQFNAAMAGMDEKARESFQHTVLSLPGPLQGFVKDFLATGTLTTEETQRIGALMGGEVMDELQNMRNKIQSGQALTAAEQDRLAAIMKKSADQQLKNASSALAGSRENDVAVNALVAASGLQTDAQKKAAAQQSDASKNTDKMNQRMEEAKQALAGFSNSFQMALANSGMLDLLMKAFTLAANLVMTYVVPAFTIIGNIVSVLGGSLIDTLMPAFEGVGNFFTDTLLPVFNELAGFIMGQVIPAFMDTVGDIMDVLSPAFKWLGGVIQEDVLPVFKSVAGFILDNLTPVLIGLGAGLATYAAVQIGQALPALLMQIPALLGMAAGVIAATWPFVAIAAAVLAAVAYFKKMGGDLQVLGDAFKIMGLKFKDWMLLFKEGIFTLLNKIPGMRGDFDKDLEEIKQERKDNADQREALEQGIADRMRQNREANAKKEEEREKKSAAITDKLNKAEHSAKLGGIKNQEEANKKDKEAKEAKATIDYGTTDSIAQLKQMAGKEGSAYIKEPAKTATSTAEAAKTATMTEAEKDKKMREEVARRSGMSEEELRKEDAKSGGGQSTPDSTGPKPAQVTPESLLAELNTKMDQLIKVNKNSFDIAERQLSVQKGLTKDLFKA